MTGAMTLQMVYIGDKLVRAHTSLRARMLQRARQRPPSSPPCPLARPQGLYRALKQAGGPVTSSQLAAAAGLDERWVREWLHQQAAARLVECDRAAERFWMTQAQMDVLSNEEGEDAR
jgi:hypothetical protein